MKLPKYPIWGKIHIAVSGGKTFCGTIERDRSLRVESGDFIKNVKEFCKRKNICRTCSRLLNSKV